VRHFTTDTFLTDWPASYHRLAPTRWRAFPFRRPGGRSWLPTLLTPLHPFKNLGTVSIFAAFGLQTTALARRGFSVPLDLGG